MPKRILQGVVVSDKQQKTVVVRVERRFTHPLLKKTVRRTKHYHAHDEAMAHKVGACDTAILRAISKDSAVLQVPRRWVLAFSRMRNALVASAKSST